MNYAQEVLDCIKTMYDGEVSIKEVIKNGRKVTGIVFGGDDSAARAVLYPYQYEDRNESVESAAADMIQRAKNEDTTQVSQEIENKRDEIADVINNWEEYVYMRALPKGRAMPYVSIPNTSFYAGITFKHNYSDAEVEKFCVNNFLNRYIRVNSLMASLLGHSIEGGEENLPESIDINDMNIVSGNIAGSTATILKPDVLHYIANKYGYDKMIILPSSIHEVIILNGENYGEGEEKAFGEMVKSVNASCVDPDEVYSDFYYIYDRNKNTLITCV